MNDNITIIKVCLVKIDIEILLNGDIIELI